MDSLPAFIERRMIEFSAPGILQVVRTSLRAGGAFGLPAIPPESIRFCPEEAKVAFEYGGEPAQWVSIEAEQLGALLVAHCIRERVPLPRRGDKGVVIKANSVLLTFQIQHAKATAPKIGAAGHIRPPLVRAMSWRSTGTQSAYGGTLDDRTQVHEPAAPADPEPPADDDRLAALLESAKPWLPAA